MRTAFVKELEMLMKSEDTYLLTGDLGFSVFENIRDNYKGRYLNMGVAEQNMLGVAAGMAITGRTVFVYSIIPFLIYRPFEQLRNDICYQNLPVRLVGVGAGFSYSDAGFTHHAIEDYGVLRSLPNLTILSPADPFEVREIMHHLNEIHSPVYMRLARNGEPVLHSKHNELKIGKSLRIMKGDDILIVSTGAILSRAMEVAKYLESNGYSVELLDYHTIKPFDEQTLVESTLGKKLVVTIEEHLLSSGLSSIVAQILAKNSIKCRFLHFGIREPYIHMSGTREFMLSLYGLDLTSILEKLKNELKLSDAIANR